MQNDQLWLFTALCKSVKDFLLLTMKQLKLAKWDKVLYRQITMHSEGKPQTGPRLFTVKLNWQVHIL